MPGKRNRLWIILSLAGMIMVILGIARGEVRVVLSKAIRVCLECIGIG